MEIKNKKQRENRARTHITKAIFNLFKCSFKRKEKSKAKNNKTIKLILKKSFKSLCSEPKGKGREKKKMEKRRKKQEIKE